jgi:hypothetical protein
MSLLARLVDDAGRVPVLWLPRPEAHPAGMLLGLGGFFGGIAAVRWTFPGHEVVAWACLVAVFAGMVLHWRLQRATSGWRVDFDARRVEPVGLRGEAQGIEGAGWSVQVAPGDRRAHVAIDLRHADRGRVARLFDVPVRGKAAAAQLDALAATIARRLRIERSGLTL